MFEDLLNVLMSSPVTEDTKYMLVIVAFVVMFGLETLVELMATVMQGAKKV